MIIDLVSDRSRDDLTIIKVNKDDKLLASKNLGKYLRDLEKLTKTFCLVLNYDMSARKSKNDGNDVEIAILSSDKRNRDNAFTIIQVTFLLYYSLETC